MVLTASAAATDWSDLLTALKQLDIPVAEVQKPAEKPPEKAPEKPPANEPSKTTPPKEQVPQTTGTGGTTPPQEQPKQQLVSNVFSGTDIREALSEVAAAVGATIIPDESIKSVAVYMEFKNESVESVLDKLALLAGAYWKKTGPNTYLMSQATPEASLFREFAVTKNYIPQNQSSTTIQSLLPANYKTFVQSDAKTNLMAITAPSALMPRILSDIQRLDAPSRQFVVEALVTQINNGNDKDFGFSWSWKNFAAGTDLGLSYAKAGFADIAKLKALITERKATLRANPRVTAFEGRESTLSVGQDTYYSILTGNVQFPTAQIQLIHTGVILKFTGFIAEDNTFTLNLEPEVSDAVVSVNGNPTTNVRRVSTTVRIKPGETIAIGGLVQETTSRRVQKVPILGSLPIVGELFTNRQNSSDKSEVIILITPRLSETGVGTTGTDSARPTPPPKG